MDPKLNPCILYTLIRISVDEGAFYDPEDPRQPMPIVTKHLAELLQKCPRAETDYEIRFKNNEDNKRKIISPKAAQDIIRNYFNTFISQPAGSMPTLTKWEEHTPLPDEISSSFRDLFNSKEKGRSRTRKQRKQQKQSRKQKQIKRK